MKKITTLLILLLSLGVYSQDIKLQGAVITKPKLVVEDISRNPVINLISTTERKLHERVTIVSELGTIEKIELARIKGDKYQPLITIYVNETSHEIPAKYFKYKRVRLTMTIKGRDKWIQDFITKNKRK